MRPQNIKTSDLDTLMKSIGAQAVASESAVQVSGLALNTNSIHTGDLYLALPGAKTHGAKYAQQAINHGAVAILTDKAGIDILQESKSEVAKVPWYVIDDPRAALAQLATQLYGTDQKTPQMFGLTGTNGKTTTSYFIRSLLAALGHKTGLIGTIEILAGDEPIPSVLTTPEAHDVHGILSVMNEKDITATVMEVSSHALEFNRVDGIMYDVVGFTNLTQDHLDLHGTMEEYFERKAKLFTKQHAKRGVVIVDDHWGKKLAAQADIDVVTLSITASDAIWHVSECHRNGVGHVFTLTHQDGTELEVKVGIPGMFNVANAALATVMIYESGVDVNRLQSALDHKQPFSTDVPGRMQVIAHKPASIVDFAHNPNAMVLAMDAVRPQDEDGKLIIVFGATGERDTTKREDMGRIAVEGADIVIITDDDPHGEPAAPIRDQLVAGAVKAAQEKPEVEILNIAPREKAIKKAVKLARNKDTILVAGRGHETVQEVMGEDIQLDDREILSTALNKRFKKADRIK
ncbi:MAG: UDP-N-acetylmuramoyl-L-alanyl-D-glutamate--2,6-diaminopimelate ligase [Micrococcaceae bacterium]